MTYMWAWERLSPKAREVGRIASRLSNGKTPGLKRWRFLLGRVVAGCAGVVLAWACVGVPLFVLPATDPLSRSDVLLVLAPTANRMEYAEQLMDQAFADTLAISVPKGKGRLRPAACDQDRSYQVVCFDPQPVTTQGEARGLRQLSKEYGWKNANVLTAQRHVTRAKVLLERCNTADVRMVPYWQDHPLLSLSDPKNSWAYIYAYETAAFIKVALNPDC